MVHSNFGIRTLGEREALFEAAREARGRAYAPYSKHPVGAAIELDGRIVSACNVENASYSLTLCAERALIGRLAARGELERVRSMEGVHLAVLGPGVEACAPCGACRQCLIEHLDPGTRVWTRGSRGWESCSLGELLPGAFAVPPEGS